MFNERFAVREEAVAKHWYTPLGYVVGGALTLTALAYAQALAGGSEATAAVREGGRLLLTLVSLVGFAVYPALLNDALYLSGRAADWRPHSVGHVAFGLAFPLAVYAVGTVAFPDRAGTLAVVSHGAAVVVTSGAYLLRRHRAVGLP
jgi:hypothetical protein